MKSANSKSFVWGTFLGSALGAAVILFCTPKSGKQMRKDLSKKWNGVRENFSEIGEEAADWLKEKTAIGKEIAEDATEHAKNLVKKGKNSVEEVKEKIKT